MSHSEDEDALALMRRANFRRREQSALNREAHPPKVSPNPFGSSDVVSPRREHAADVLDEDEPWTGLGDDPARRSPEVSFVEAALLSPGDAVRLARDAPNDAIHEAAPWSAVEGSGITPHRCLSQETRLHRCDQVRDGEGFPLHHADRSNSWHCQLETEIEASSTGAEGDDVDGLGRYSHVMGRRDRFPLRR
nr:hypothetical protein [Acuticoccus sediminis]